MNGYPGAVRGLLSWARIIGVRMMGISFRPESVLAMSAVSCHFRFFLSPTSFGGEAEAAAASARAA